MVDENRAKESTGITGSIRSFKNTPQAARTTQKIGPSVSSDEMLSAVTPGIEQLYDPSQAKCLPGKARKGKAEFVDWGTKLYQLELELSYKTNEILVLQKKLKKFATDLYPGGDTNKKSRLQTLRNQNENLRKRIATKDRELKWEQKRCKGLSNELAAARIENKFLKKQERNNDKSVQTEEDKAVQVRPRVRKPTTRTTMTQCEPTVVKVTNSTTVTSSTDMRPNKCSVTFRTSPRDRNMRSITSSTEESKSHTSNATSFKTNYGYRSKSKPETVTVENKVKVEIEQKETKQSESTAVAIPQSNAVPHQFIPSKPGVKFASEMTIKEKAGTSQEVRDPLEMSIFQEVNDKNGVKTVVKSNRDFDIKQKPMLVSATGQVKSGIEYTSRPQRIQSTSASEADSGRSSYASGYASPSSIFKAHPPKTPKVSFSQSMDGTTSSVSISTDDRTYERNMPNYMTPPPYPVRVASPNRDTRFNTTAWEIYNKGAPSHGGVVPYYLFKRSNEGKLRETADEKPIFVHVSEIMMKN